MFFAGPYGPYHYMVPPVVPPKTSKLESQCWLAPTRGSSRNPTVNTSCYMPGAPKHPPHVLIAAHERRVRANVSRSCKRE